MTFCMLQTYSKAHKIKQASAVQAISHYHKSLNVPPLPNYQSATRVPVFLETVHTTASQTKEKGENNLWSEK